MRVSGWAAWCAYRRWQARLEELEDYRRQWLRHGFMPMIQRLFRRRDVRRRLQRLLGAPQVERIGSQQVVVGSPVRAVGPRRRRASAAERQ